MSALAPPDGKPRKPARRKWFQFCKPKSKDDSFYPCGRCWGPSSSREPDFGPPTLFSPRVMHFPPSGDCSGVTGRGIRRIGHPVPLKVAQNALRLRYLGLPSVPRDFISSQKPTTVKGTRLKSIHRDAVTLRSTTLCHVPRLRLPRVGANATSRSLIARSCSIGDWLSSQQCQGPML